MKKAQNILIREIPATLTIIFIGILIYFILQMPICDIITGFKCSNLEITNKEIRFDLQNIQGKTTTINKITAQELNTNTTLKCEPKTNRAQNTNKIKIICNITEITKENNNLDIELKITYTPQDSEIRQRTIGTIKTNIRN